MTTRGRPRRFAVALDASAGSRQALDAAARLASAEGAELIGIHVADVELLRWAALPFASTIGAASAVARPADLTEIRRRLERQRFDAERMLAEVSERHRVPASFRALEGVVIEALLEACAEVDLLAVGKGASGLGSVARRLLARAGHTDLLLASERPLVGGVAVAVRTATPPSAAVRLATRLSAKGEVIVLSLGPGPTEAESLPEGGTRTRVVEVPSHDVGRIAPLARQAGAGVLVLPTRRLALQPRLVEVVVRRFPGFVVIEGGA